MSEIVQSQIPPPPMPTSAKQITRTWGIVTALSWVALGFALLALALASRQLGKPVWWLGSQTAPRFIGLWVAPFLAPVFVIVFSLRSSRWTPLVSLVSSASLGAIAAFDIQLTPGIAIGEFVLVGVGVLISVASLAGRTTVNTYPQPQ